jgi:hypothetical protein
VTAARDREVVAGTMIAAAIWSITVTGAGVVCGTTWVLKPFESWSPVTLRLRGRT